MNIWIVYTDVEYDQDVVYGYFSTKAKAEKAKKQILLGDVDPTWLCISTIQLDQLNYSEIPRKPTDKLILEKNVKVGDTVTNLLGTYTFTNRKGKMNIPIGKTKEETALSANRILGFDCFEIFPQKHES